MAALLLVAVLVFLAWFVARARRERAARTAAATTTKFEVDGWGVKRWLADGRYEEVSWDELVEVRVLTLPRGPWPTRTRFVLDGGGERGCIVALDLAEERGLVAALGALPGFDHRSLAELLEQERTGNRVLWSRDRRTST